MTMTTKGLAAPSTMWLLQTLSIACLYPSVFGFVPSPKRYQTCLSATSTGGESSQWLNCGLLISSWSDGVLPNPEALEFLKKGLACSLLSELQRNAENSVESSVIFSPCCGPDTEALTNMELVDKTLESVQQDPTAINEWLDRLDTPIDIKVLYIPTALYALRADSTNSPGKQRQRARADGKKRRTHVVETIQKLFRDKVNVLAVTLDLDDGSIKQPQGSDDENDFPNVRRTLVACHTS